MIYTITVLILKLKILIYKSLNYKLLNKVILHGIPKIVYPQRVSIGSSTRINPRVFLQAAGGITIGNNVTLSYGVTILSTGYCLKNWSTNKYLKEHEDIPIYISDDVWVGANVTILSGVAISEGVVIAAGSVVTKSLDCPNSLYAGIPAKKIRELP